jgi:VanZ family protein
MSLTEVGNYIQKLFQNHILVCFAAIGAFLYNFFFPDTQYLYSAIAVLGIMLLDLLTKLYALNRQAGGLKKAIHSQQINSFSFFRGTMDKLFVFGVMMIICGFAYRLTVISSIAIWFTQAVYTLMFFRDVLSIFENFRDAGIKDMGMFEKLVKKKMEQYIDEDGVQALEETPYAQPVQQETAATLETVSSAQEADAKG